MKNRVYKNILYQLNYLINELGKAKVANELKVARGTIYNWIKHPEKMTIQNVLNLQFFYDSYMTFRSSMK